jgi:uroporphyrinogen decarboxylase
MDAEEMVAMLEQKTEAPKIRQAQRGELTLRERYRRAINFRKVDRMPNFEFGYWAETLNNWHREGLPAEVKDEKSAYEYFGIENWKTAPINVMGMKPAFEHEVLEEDEKYLTYRDSSGYIARINKTGDKSIPQYIDFPIKDRATWEAFKFRLQPGADRVPENWAELVAAYNQRDYPLCVPIGSMIGTPRNWIGFENIAMMIYDDPELLEEIVETLCCLVTDTLARILPDVEFDFAAGWEDICFNSGPIVGVNFMREVVMPRYKRITDLLNRHGCHVAFTDCDGNISAVVDSFLGGGINCMFPVEVHGGSDPVALRAKYPDLRMQGGFDKMKLLAGKKAILAELKRLLPVVNEGGFIPGVDHRVQADVSLENYKYYLKMKRELFETGGMPQYDETKI